MSALVAAAKANDPEQVAMLLVARPSTEEMRDAAVASILQDSAAVLAVLLENGLDPNTRIPGHGWTLLHVAAECMAPASLDLLLASGADANARADAGWSPLHHAVDSEADHAHQAEAPPEPKLTSALLAAGADPSVENAEGETPLDLAREYEYRAALDLMNAYMAARRA